MSVDTLVSKIKLAANAGTYGSPKSPSFMNNVAQDVMQNVSSPLKAQAFAKFYKMHNKQKTPTYKPIAKMGGVKNVKKTLQKLKKDKGMKATKKSPKTPSPNVQAKKTGALKAMQNYQKMKASLK